MIIYGVVAASFRPSARLPTVAMFYQGWIATSTHINTLDRFDSTGALVGSQVSAGDALYLTAGASVEDVGIFYGGIDAVNGYSWSSMAGFDSAGASVSGASSVAGPYYGQKQAGAGSQGMGCFFGYGGNSSAGLAYVENRFQRVDKTLAQVGSHTTLGTGRDALSGAGYAGSVLYYAGLGSDWVTTITRVDPSNASLLSETSGFGTARDYLAGDTAESYEIGIFVGGWVAMNTITRIDATGAQVGSETTASVGHQQAGVGSIDSMVMRNSGWDGNALVTNNERIDHNGATVGSVTSLPAGATARDGHSGAGVT